jgi:hypothetical protein
MASSTWSIPTRWRERSNRRGKTRGRPERHRKPPWIEAVPAAHRLLVKQGVS